MVADWNAAEPIRVSSEFHSNEMERNSLQEKE
jgi:hypothetical protein